MKPSFFRWRTDPFAAAYFLVLALLIVYRYLVITRFSLVYSDSDQAVMWLGVRDYADGLFHEPRFYGQAYNSMLEALLAVPFYKAGMEAYRILPVITSVLALAPFVIISFFTFRKRSRLMALVILSFPFLLPPEYDLLTSLPRGFVTGIFLASLASIAIFYERSRWSFFVSGLGVLLGYTLNANSLLLTLPCLLYLFLLNYQNRHFYVLAAAGLASGALIHFSINYFYVLHPFYDLHKLELSYSLRRLLGGLGRPDILLDHVTPLAWNASSLSLLVFLFAGAVLFQQEKKKEALAVLSVLPLALLMFGVDKTWDGTASVFFSPSRMYLALPVALCMAFSFMNVRQGKLLLIYLLLPVSFFIYKAGRLDQDILTNVYERIHIILVRKTSDILAECRALGDYSAANEVRLMVIQDHPDYDFLTYGCPAAVDDFPPTLRPYFERRTWRLLEDEKKIYRNILLIDIRSGLPGKFSLAKVRGEGLIMIRDNHLYTMDLLRTLGLEIRQYKDSS
jgi:hypothetical protein